MFKPFRYLILPILALLASFVATRSISPENSQPVRVFVLRHAEAEASDPSDRNPGLSPAGTERAQALSKLLAKAGVTNLFCSEFKRTQDTLEPLAVSLGLTSKVISARSPEQQVAEINALPAGSVAVIAGHSNTAPGLVERLGVELTGVERDPQQGPLLGHDQYDRLFLIHLPRIDQVPPSVLELRYGR